MCLPQGYHRKGESVKGSSSKGKASIVLWYVKASLRLLDSNWAGNPFDHISTTRYSVYLGYNPITWSAKKQEIVSIFSTEDTEDGTVLIFFHRTMFILSLASSVISLDIFY